MNEIIQIAFTMTGIDYIVAVLGICVYGAIDEGEPIAALEIIAILAVVPLAANLLAAYVWVNLL